MNNKDYKELFKTNTFHQESFSADCYKEFNKWIKKNRYDETNQSKINIINTINYETGISKKILNKIYNGFASECKMKDIITLFVYLEIVPKIKFQKINKFIEKQYRNK